jgi:hypothetical protein
MFKQPSWLLTPSWVARRIRSVVRCSKSYDASAQISAARFYKKDVPQRRDASVVAAHCGVELHPAIAPSLSDNS